MSATRLWCWRPDALESLYASRAVVSVEARAAVTSGRKPA
ncbi:MAG: hypothetical protein JWM76_2163 [Pseudonocardiales bacterium]|nr:hypothetical protein [Pseudonocardiales bacterium]